MGHAFALNLHCANGLLDVRRSHYSAFTLIETISVIVVLAILGSIVATLVSAFARSYADTAVVSDLHGEMSLALDRLVRDIRSMPPDPDAGQSAADIRYASQTELRWDDTNHVRLVGSIVEISDDHLAKFARFCGTAVDQNLDDVAFGYNMMTCMPFAFPPAVRV